MSTCKDLDRLLEYFVETGLPGCSLMICRKGDVIYEGHAGYANVDTKEKIRPDSIYRLASMSKIPLYTTMMMLFERGMYNMKTPLAIICPSGRNPAGYRWLPTAACPLCPPNAP